MSKSKFKVVVICFFDIELGHLWQCTQQKRPNLGQKDIFFIFDSVPSNTALLVKKNTCVGASTTLTIFRPP
jgi:hypothetical protein